MIQDNELRDLFRAESTEHLRCIEGGLLRLEQTPGDAPLLEEVFREAHSLKGAARMLGLREVQTRAHALETLLSEARQGTIQFDPGRTAALLATLDEIRGLVAEALGDLPATGPVPDRIADESLTPAGWGTTTAMPRNAAAITTTVSAIPEQVTPSVTKPEPQTAGLFAGLSAGTPPTLGPDFRIDTLRIESSRLDTLLQLGAELVVSQGRLTRNQAELGHLVARCEHALRQPGGVTTGLAELTANLESLHRRLAADNARQETLVGQLEGGIRHLRLLPLSNLLDRFPRMVHDLAIELGKQVAYQVEGGSTVADKRILEELKAPLTHLLRNAIDHGIEPPAERLRAGKPPQGRIRITVSQVPDAVQITVSDDGRGLDREAILRQALKQRLHRPEDLHDLTDAQVQALIFTPGLSTAPLITELSGRGVGMDAVHTSIERLRGSLTLVSEPGCGLTIQMRLPVSLAATCALLVREWGQTYALPFDAIVRVTRWRPEEIQWLEGRQCLFQGDRAIPLERLGLLLERASPGRTEPDRPGCVVLQVDGESFALALDEILETEDIVVKPTTAPLTRVRHVAGLAILNAGVVCPVLNPYDLLRSLGRRGRTGSQSPEEATPEPVPRRILLVEDSITTRVQERRILEGAGYTVVTAVDGLDAWGQLARQDFDAVVSDVQMPRLTGFELTEKIRQHRRFVELPVVLVTSLASEADRRRGLEVGADAYITKSEFDQRMLLDCLARLL